MCGIAGILLRDGRSPERSVAERMIACLTHRGPDQRAVHVEPHVALASARLSIVDLSPAADQPLTDSSGDLVIVFNGEIYNFMELRAELEAEGCRFRSHSDTEVVLEAYRRWGAECQQRFNGMWAFALWDRRNRLLFLSRDRFGVKPLYIAERNDELLFASEIKSLLAAGVPGTLASEAFNRYCGGESMFEGIEAIPAGSCVAYRLDRDQPMRRVWWDTLENLTVPPKRYRERVDAFRDLLTDSVRLRLRADVTPTVTLSGGLDSSSIYACSQSLSREGRALSATDGRPIEIRASMVSFPGSVIDESEPAGLVAGHFGKQVGHFEVNPDDFRSLVEKATWHQEGLVWNASVLAYHEFYRQLAESGTRVVLEGHGADELLAGYANFAEDATRERLRAFRLISAWSAATAAARTRNPALGHKERSAFMKLAGGAVRAVIPMARRRAADRGSIIDRDLLTRFSAPPAFTEDLPSLTPLKRALYAGFHKRLLPTVLRVNDRATMAWGVESRAPFLDYRLVSFVFSLSDDDILGRGWTKRVLRDAMRPLLPADILWARKKFGFLAPQPEWFRRPAVIAAMNEALSDGTIARTAGLDRRKFAEVLARGTLAGFNWQESTELWTAYSYAIWSEMFLSNRSSVPKRELASLGESA